MYDPNQALTTAGSAGALIPAGGRSTVSQALLLAVLALPLSAAAQANRERLIRSMEDVMERQRPPVLPAPPIKGIPQPGAGPEPATQAKPQGNPTPGAGRSVFLPVVDSSKNPAGGVTQGTGVNRVDVGATPPPPANAPAPVLATAPASVAAPPPAIAVAPPRSETAPLSAPATAPAPVIAAAPAVKPPLAEPGRIPVQGAGLPDGPVVQGAGPVPAPSVFAAPANAPAPTAVAAGSLPVPNASAGMATSAAANPKPPVAAVPNTMDRNVVQGDGRSEQLVMGVSAAFAPPGAALGEILPGAKELSDSRQLVSAPVQSGKALTPETTVAKVSARCQTISIRPDAQRQAVSLVDFTGDKLIVAAVPDTHINTVFDRAGYNRLDLSQAATWCVLPSVARELLQPVQTASTQEAALVVQTGSSLQLMSRDQWLTYQASLKPVVTASLSNKTAVPLKGGNRAGSKAARQSGKATFNLLRPTAVSGKPGGLLPSS